jgi:SNF2 family DNA or RNA helicase
MVVGLRDGGMGKIQGHVIKTAKGYLLQIPYHERAVMDLREFPGLRWDPKMKAWWISEDLVEVLVEFLRGRMDISPPRNMPKLAPAGGQLPLEGVLRPYQKDAVRWLLGVRSGILGLDMGLGKGLCAISAARAEPGPYLVVIPAQARRVWCDDGERVGEVRKWIPDADVRVAGSVRTKAGKKIRYVPNLSVLNDLGSNSWVVINYELLDPHAGGEAVAWGKVSPAEPLPGETVWLEELAQVPFTVMIVDEVHAIKERHGPRSLAVRRLAHLLDTNTPGRRRGIRRIGLTGTPIWNRTPDLWALLDWVRPGAFGGFWSFAIRYCGAVEDGYGWKTREPTNQEELSRRLRWFIYRLSKDDSQVDLPPKLRRVIVVDDPEMEAELQKTITDYLRRTGSVPRREVLRDVLHRGSMPKIRRACHELDATGDRSIVFTHRRDTAERAAQEFADALGGDRVVWCIHGGVGRKSASRAIDEWSVSDRGVLVATMDYAGLGIDLSAGSIVIFLDLDYLPKKHEQAEDRAWRPPQRNRVLVIYLAVRNSPDEEIAHILVEKLDQYMTLMGKESSAARLRADFARLLDAKTVLGQLRDRLLAMK